MLNEMPFKQRYVPNFGIRSIAIIVRQFVIFVEICRIDDSPEYDPNPTTATTTTHKKLAAFNDFTNSFYRCMNHINSKFFTIQALLLFVHEK